MRDGSLFSRDVFLVVTILVELSVTHLCPARKHPWQISRSSLMSWSCDDHTMTFSRVVIASHIITCVFFTRRFFYAQKEKFSWYSGKMIELQQQENLISPCNDCLYIVVTCTRLDNCRSLVTSTRLECSQCFCPDSSVFKKKRIKWPIFSRITWCPFESQVVEIITTSKNWISWIRYEPNMISARTSIGRKSWRSETKSVIRRSETRHEMNLFWRQVVWFCTFRMYIFSSVSPLEHIEIFLYVFQ